MPLRIAVTGGLKEPGYWDAYARTVGEHLARGGAGLTLAADSGFARAVVQGYRKVEAEPAAGLVRVHGAPPGGTLSEDLAPFALKPLPRNVAGEPVDQFLREADGLLIAGNGPGLPDLYRRAVNRRIPVVPLPIAGATSEDLWEQDLRTSRRVFPSHDLRTVYLGLRRPDPRSAQSAASVAGLLVGLATAPDLPGGPSVLLARRPGEGPPGEDDLPRLLHRGLRAHARGARVTEAPTGWLHAPGKAFADAARSTDLLVTEIGAENMGALYALGIARGAGRPTLALTPRGGAPGVDPRAVDALTWQDDRELAAKLEHRLRSILRDASPRPQRAKTKGRKGRPRRNRGKGKPAGKKPAGEEEGKSPRPGERERGGGRKEG